MEIRKANCGSKWLVIMDSRRLNHYFALSFAVSSLLCGFLFWGHPDFFNKGFFTSLFFLGSFVLWESFWPISFLPLIFLFQAFSLLASGFEFGETYPIFLSLVPLLSGIYFLKEKMEKIYLLGFFAISFIAIKLIFKISTFGVKDYLSYFVALSWGAGLILFKSEKSALKEKYLFHDILNYIHGISLFLSGRGKNGLSSRDAHNLSKEMDSLRDIIFEYFGRTSEKKGIESYKIEEAIKALCDQFLFKTNFSVQINGILDEEEIPLNEFFRAMGNLLKNVSESNAKNCHILIENQGSGISIIVQNDFSQMTKNQGQGIGLRSTQEILEKIGGIFCFFKEKNQWISRIYIPYINYQKIAA